jgi:hypothetical protein
LKKDLNIVKNSCKTIIKELNNLVSNKLIYDFSVFDFRKLLKLSENDIELYGTQ